MDKCKTIFGTVRVSVEQALKKISFGDGEAISESLETLHAWEKLLKVKAWLGNQGISNLSSVDSCADIHTSTYASRQLANSAVVAVSVETLGVTGGWCSCFAQLPRRVLGCLGGGHPRLTVQS